MASDTNTPQTVPILPSTQLAQQTIIINTPKKSSRKERFKSRLALIFGITLIISASIAILMQCILIWTLSERTRLGHIYHGPGRYGYGTFLSAPLTYLCGSFAIVSAKKKTRGFIIATMVFGILVAVFVAPMVYTSSKVIAYERPLPSNMQIEIDGLFTTQNPINPEQAESLRKGSLICGVFMLLCGISDFICSIVLAALCCAVVCCGRSTDSSQVIYLNSPTGVTNANLGDVSMYPANMVPQASGGDLPPPYSAPDNYKVDLGHAEATECPTKAPLPGI